MVERDKGKKYCKHWNRTHNVERSDDGENLEFVWIEKRINCYVNCFT